MFAFFLDRGIIKNIFRGEGRNKQKSKTRF
jgi:hypothetical protein